LKILHRYILREVLINFCIALFVFTSILFVVRMLRLTSMIINRGVDFSQVAMVFVSIIPTFLEVAIPLSALLGVMLAFARLSGDSEIIVIRASGTSLLQLLRPVVVFAGFAMLLGLVVSTNLKPWGYQQLSTSLFEIARSRSTAGLTEGIFNELGSLTLYAEKIEHRSGQLERVMIDDRRDPAERKVIFAKTGSIRSDPGEQTITFLLHDGEIHERVGDKYVLTHFNTNGIVIDPDELYAGDGATSRLARPRELSNEDLVLRLQSTKAELRAARLDPDFAPDELQELRRKIQQVRIERATRFSLPVAAFLLALFAMPLGIHPARAQRTWGLGLSVFIGLIVFLVYFALFTFGMALAEAGTISPLVGAWTPNILIALIAIFTLRKMSSEQWQSVSEAAQRFFVAISRLVVRSK